MRSASTCCRLELEMRIKKGATAVRNAVATSWAPVTVVSKILGHSSVSTTLNIYAHVLAEHMEQFERQRARILGAVGRLTRVRLQKRRKARTIYDAGWSSLVARRAHNPEVVGSNPTPATSNPNDSQGLLIRRESGALFDLQLS